MNSLGRFLQQLAEANITLDYDPVWLGTVARQDGVPLFFTRFVVNAENLYSWEYKFYDRPNWPYSGLSGSDWGTDAEAIYAGFLCSRLFPENLLAPTL